jgi:hypothetical protein
MSTDNKVAFLLSWRKEAGPMTMYLACIEQLNLKALYQYLSATQLRL